ncbi:MAG: hypothetical protein Q9217_004225 [Psora testacea]
MVPRSASRVYTGRGEIGERLAQVLSFDPSTPPKQQRTFVIIGAGGTGKSEVFLKFAEDHRDDQRWLLILDNADDAEIDYSEYMPPAKGADSKVPLEPKQVGIYITYAKFEVSADYLQKSKLPESTDALNFLHTLAFMHNSEISEIMIQRTSEYAFELKDTGTSNDKNVLSLSVCHVARLPEYLQQGWSSQENRLRWYKARNLLESLSIITVHQDDDSNAISVHFLVHVWAKERQDYQSRYSAWQSAVTIVALSCKGWYDFCPFFVFLQPHVRACINHEIEEYTQTMSDIEAGQILFQFAYVLYQLGDDSSLDFLVQRIRLRLENRRGVDQETALQIKAFTGRVYWQQGKYGEAVDVFREIVECRSGALAEDDPFRLSSQNELARAYRINGRIDEAIELFEHIAKVIKKLPEDHPFRLTSQRELANPYKAMGELTGS